MEGLKNETSNDDPGLKKVSRHHTTVHVHFRTPEQAARFEQFMKQEIQNGNP